MSVTRSARIFIHANSGGFDVLCQIPHEMSAQNYLTQVAFRRNETIHAEVLLGRYVSADPVIGTSFGALEAGDEIVVTWQDINGGSGEQRRTFEGNTD